MEIVRCELTWVTLARLPLGVETVWYTENLYIATEFTSSFTVFCEFLAELNLLRRMCLQDQCCRMNAIRVSKSTLCLASKYSVSTQTVTLFYDTLPTAWQLFFGCIVRTDKSGLTIFCKFTLLHYSETYICF